MQATEKPRTKAGEGAPAAHTAPKPAAPRRPRVSFVSRLAATVFAVIIAIAVSHILELFQVRTAYLVFLPAITGACALGGLEMGLWAAGLSTLALWWFFIPPAGFYLPDRADLAHLCVFGIVACFGCWLIDRLRSTREELWRDNVMLGRKISALLGRKKTP